MQLKYLQDNHIKEVIVKSSHLGLPIDPRSDSSVSNEVQRTVVILQLYHEGKLYSRIQELNPNEELVHAIPENKGR